MQPGNLNKKVYFFKFIKQSDNFGGFKNTRSFYLELWANVNHKGGEIVDTFGKREIDRQVEIILRNDPGDSYNINIGDVVNLSASDSKFDYRINEVFLIKDDNYLIIKGTQGSKE